MRKGFLVSFEGGEGCGKSTQIRKLAKLLDERGIEYVVAKEPGATELGEQIRNILLHTDLDLSSKTELLLFCASRSRVVENVINPALEQGKVVIMDRYYDSSFAYEGYAGSVNLKDIETITKFTIGEDAEPDLTFLFDLDYEAGIERKLIDHQLETLDRFESKGKEYFDCVRNGYLDIAKKNKKRIVVVDASQSIQDVYDEVVKVFDKRYKKKMNEIKKQQD